MPVKIYRRQRIKEFIQAVLNRAAAEERVVSKDKLIAETCLNFNMGERLVKEILKHFEVLEEIVIEGNSVWTKNAYHAQKVLNDQEVKD